jgi:hypothetical protein
MNASGVGIGGGGARSVGTCAYTHPDTAGGAAFQVQVDNVNAAVRQLGGGIQTGAGMAAVPAEALVSSFSSATQLAELKTAIQEKASSYIDVLVAATIAPYVLVCAFGIIGLVLDCKKCHLFGSLSLLFAFVAMILTGVLIAAEIGINVVTADLCVPTPNENLLRVLNASGSTNDFFEYAMLCGQQPMMENPVRNSTEAMTGAVAVLRANLCNATRDYAGNYTYVDAGLGAIEFPKQFPADCAADLDTAGVELTAVGVDFNRVLETALSCGTLNAPVNLLTQEAICSNFAPGLHHMWNTQVACSVLLALLMLITPWAHDRIREGGEGAGEGGELELGETAAGDELAVKKTRTIM